MTVIIIAKNSSVGKKKLLTSDSYFIEWNITQWAKSPKKQSEGVILSAESTKTHSFRLFFGDFAIAVIIRLYLTGYNFQ